MYSVVPRQLRSVAAPGVLELLPAMQVRVLVLSHSSCRAINELVPTRIGTIILQPITYVSEVGNNTLVRLRTLEWYCINTLQNGLARLGLITNTRRTEPYYKQ
jgi:hypothetical protein